jgi:hypothetical protein
VPSRSNVLAAVRQEEVVGAIQPLRDDLGGTTTRRTRRGPHERPQRPQLFASLLRSAEHEESPSKPASCGGGGRSSRASIVGRGASSVRASVRSSLPADNEAQSTVSEHDTNKPVPSTMAAIRSTRTMANGRMAASLRPPEPRGSEASPSAATRSGQRKPCGASGYLRRTLGALA